MNGKLCRGCDTVKDVAEFSRRKRSKDGLQAKCKGCERAYYAANREQVSARMSKYREANRERITEQQRAYRDANREWYDQYQRAYAEENREQITGRQRAYYAANRERITGRQRAYKASNRERYAGYAAKRRAIKRNAPHEPYDRTTIFAAYNNECVYCGAEAVHLDHVVPISKGGPDAAHNLLPACAECNLSKGARSLAEWALTWLSGPEESLALKAQHHSEEENGSHDLQNA